MELTINKQTFRTRSPILNLLFPTTYEVPNLRVTVFPEDYVSKSLDA